MKSPRRSRPARLRMRGGLPPVPFGRFIGMRVLSLGGGRAAMEAAFTPAHHNPGGVVHGGAIFTLLDSSMGAALRSLRPSRASVAIEVHVRYLQPVVSGRVKAEGRVVRRGRRIAVMESVARQGRREVARATGSFYLL